MVSTKGTRGLFQPLETGPLTFLQFGAQVAVVSVVQAMTQAQVHCVLLLNEVGRITGIFTDRDLLRVCGDGQDLSELPIAQLMTPQVVTITATAAAEPVQVLQVFQRFPINYLPVIAENGEILRVMTRAEAQQQGQPIARLRLQSIQSVLTPQTLPIQSGQTLQQVAKLLSHHHHHYAIVVDETGGAGQSATPIGVVTQSDILQARGLRHDLAQMTVEEVMSAPPRLIATTATLWEAAMLMQRYFIRQLVVVDEQGYLAGMVSLENILRLLDPLDLWQALSSCQQRSTEQAITIESLEYQQKHQTIELQRLQQELFKAQQEIERQAYIDPLTQIANRRQFDQLLAQEWQRLRREKQPIAVILADVDYFQEYNDHFGYPLGDRALQQIAAALSGVIPRSTDWVARYGGDEFVFLLPYTELVGVQRVIERSQQALRQLALRSHSANDGNYVTLSFGGATCMPNFGDTFADLLTGAERALYKAKQEGRDRGRIGIRTEHARQPKFQLVDAMSNCQTASIQIDPGSANSDR